jgi:hypothetical protein
MTVCNFNWLESLVVRPWRFEGSNDRNLSELLDNHANSSALSVNGKEVPEKHPQTSQKIPHSIIIVASQ